MTRCAERGDGSNWEIFSELYDVPEKYLKIDIRNSEHSAKQFTDTRSSSPHSPTVVTIYLVIIRILRGTSPGEADATWRGRRGDAFARGATRQSGGASDSTPGSGSAGLGACDAPTASGSTVVPRLFPFLHSGELEEGPAAPSCAEPISLAHLGRLPIPVKSLWPGHCDVLTSLGWSCVSPQVCRTPRAIAREGRMDA